MKQCNLTAGEPQGYVNAKVLVQLLRKIIYQLMKHKSVIGRVESAPNMGYIHFAINQTVFTLSVIEED